MIQDITTASENLNVKRKTNVIERDRSKVICRLYVHGGDPAKIKKLIHRIAELDDQKTEALLRDILDDFSQRHRNLEEIFRHHFQEISKYIDTIDYSFSEERELLIGAYFTMEYAIESAALFNPSIVPHPDQSGVPEGSLRFIMSLRAVGEGHISSLVFRSGIINSRGELAIELPSSYVNQPESENPVFSKTQFDTSLKVLEKDSRVSAHILDKLPDQFTYDDLRQQMMLLDDSPKFSNERQLRGFNDMHHLADSNYQLHFNPESDLSERVIFPVSEEEQGGIEDARFVQFHEDDGSTVYYATYTAYDGSDILPQLIETEDFCHFKMRTLYGQAAKDKDMALFPRKINGQYVMLSRQDGINTRIMFSDDIRHWQKSKILQEPSEPWELIKTGNCGSPIETPYGWLVFMHGVGPMRAYSIGAILLDLEDPTHIIKRLKPPLLKALEHQQVGYVPNVVYTCGAILHNGQLIIPYALSDFQPAFAWVGLDELIEVMEPV